MNKKETAIKLRGQGYSYSMIQEQVPVSKATLSQWLSPIEFTPNKSALKRAKLGPIRSGERRRIEKQKARSKTLAQAKKDVQEITERDLFMLGLGLYIGEGSKSLESVRMINSDPNVIKIAVKWFRLIAEVEPKDLMIEIHGYPDIDIQKSKRYWSRVTNVPKENFTKVQIDTRKKTLGSDRKLEFGTIQLRVRANGDKSKGVELFRKIEGWTMGIVDQI